MFTGIINVERSGLKWCASFETESGAVLKSTNWRKDRAVQVAKQTRHHELKRMHYQDYLERQAMAGWQKFVDDLLHSTKVTLNPEHPLIVRAMQEFNALKNASELRWANCVEEFLPTRLRKNPPTILNTKPETDDDTTEVAGPERRASVPVQRRASQERSSSGRH